MVYGLLLDRWKDTTTGIALPNLCSAPNSRDEALGGVRGSERNTPVPLSCFYYAKAKEWHHQVTLVALQQVLSIEQIFLPVVDGNLP